MPVHFNTCLFAKRKNSRKRRYAYLSKTSQSWIFPMWKTHPGSITWWWFQIVFTFTLLGEMIQFDKHIQMGGSKNHHQLDHHRQTKKTPDLTTTKPQIFDDPRWSKAGKQPYMDFWYNNTWVSEVRLRGRSGARHFPAATAMLIDDPGVYVMFVVFCCKMWHKLAIY